MLANRLREEGKRNIHGRPRALFETSRPLTVGRTLLRNLQNETVERNLGGASERTCIVSRRTAPRDELIRLALSPDGEVAPDVRARAPGRGAWIGVGRAELDSAQAKGKLKAALARAFKKGVSVPADLGERIAAALRQQALDRLGLEARGRWQGSGRLNDAVARAKSPCYTPPSCEEGNAAIRRGAGAAGTVGLYFRKTNHLACAWPRKCGTCRPDRSRRRAAGEPCHRPVAYFH